MNQSLATPTATTALRRMWARVWSDADARSTTIGILAVLIFHLLLWLLGPRLLQFDQISLAQRPHSSAREFNIELAPETFAKAPVKPKDPFKFVETNPEAPENTPDKTENFAAQNQQVAQEKPTPDGKSDRPALEGKKDFQSTQIVSGRLSQPLEHVVAQPPPSDLPTAETPVSAPRAQQNPLAGTEKFEGENKDSVGGSVAKRLEDARSVPEKVDGVKDARDVESPTANHVAIDPRRPMVRPQLAQTHQVRPAIFAENRVGTARIGPTAVDAKWSNYGVYLSRMIETVQEQWDILVSRLTANPANGSSVSVKFIMNSDGQISDIVNIESTANATGERACVTAITMPAPYGPWTDDMKAVLGEKQEMTFTFYYLQ